MIKELKDFLFKGNVLELAVAVLIAAAFGLIITSFVDNIISPLIGMFGGTDLSELTFTANGVLFTYGAFLNTVINFLIVGTVLFMVVKAATRIQERNKAEEVVVTETPEDIILLREIRDSLGARR